MFTISSGSGDDGAVLQGLLRNWEWPQVLGAASFPSRLVTASVPALPRHTLGFVTASPTSLAGVGRCSEAPFSTQVGGKSANEPCRHRHSVAPTWAGDRTHLSLGIPQAPWDARHTSPLLSDSQAVYFYHVPFSPLGSRGHLERTGEGDREQKAGFSQEHLLQLLLFHYFSIFTPYLSWGHTCFLVWLK